MGIQWAVRLIVLGLVFGGMALAQESPTPLTLEESIKIALTRNLSLQSAEEGVRGAQFRVKSAWADFFPRWTGQYGYTRYSGDVSLGATRIGGFGGTGGGGFTRDVYNFNTTLDQPLFAGGAISSNYDLERYGVDVSKADLEATKRDIVLFVREGYFNILRSERFVGVGRQAVKQFEAQLEVAKAFFDVGIVAKNDVLQADVRLANARQALVRAENDAAVAKSSFNTLLRREINAPLAVVDILEYRPSPITFEEALGVALVNRPEIRAAESSIRQAEEAIKVARSEFFPTVSLAGNYSRLSEEATLQGDIRDERWTVQGLATFTIFNMGKTYYKVGENKVKLTQAEKARAQLIDDITLELKQAHLSVLQAEKNIGVAQKSIEQAEENLRMNEERYKYQVATSTDVLDAVTLLAQASVNYYSALSDFNIAKARLDRAMGRMFP